VFWIGGGDADLQNHLVKNDKIMHEFNKITTFLSFFGAGGGWYTQPLHPPLDPCLVLESIIRFSAKLVD